MFTSQKVSHQHFASCLEPPNNQCKMSDSSKLPRQHGSSGSVNDHHCYPCKESITRFGRWRRASVWGGESSRPVSSLCKRGRLRIAFAAGRRLSLASGHTLRWGLRKYFFCTRSAALNSLAGERDNLKNIYI